MLRSLYYAFSPNLRFVVRRLYYLPADLLFPQKNKMIPPRGLIYTGRGDFEAQGNKYVDLFKQNGLKKEHHFLDIGSGIGRVAVPLTSFLSENATYKGFDVVEKGVNWCSTKISKWYPNFEFTFIPLLNDLYRESGQDASKFTFPYPDNSFDYACAISVFTHMVSSEVKNYYCELARVMKPGSICFATFFILNEQSAELMKAGDFKFTHKTGNHYLMSEKVKSANVAFDETHLFSEIIDPHEFEISKLSYGHWSGRKEEDCLDFQDVVVVTKK